MNDPLKQVSTGGEEPKIPIEDLIRANHCQKMLAEATIKHLTRALEDQERLAKQDIELERLKRLQVAWEIEQLTKGNE